MTTKHFFIFVLVYSYFGSFLYSENFYMSMQKEQAVNSVLNEAEKKISKRYGMTCAGSGAAMMYEVERLRLMFSIKESLSKEEARKIIVDSTEEFLGTINSDLALRKYLKSYPFGIDDISLSILIYNQDGTKNYHPDLSAVGFVKGNIRYHTTDIEKPWVYKETTEESFENAKQIVEQQKQQELQKVD